MYKVKVNDAQQFEITEETVDGLDIIETSKELGMISLETSLSELVHSGAISLETAKSYASHPDDLLRMVA